MRDQLLNAAEVMVQERGLNAVSFQDLANAVGLSKPSVFHHFKNREALVQALIERCHTDYGAGYDAIIQEDRSAPEKLRSLARLFEENSGKGRICLLSAIGNSASGLSSAAQANLRSSTKATIQRFSRVFEQGLQEGSLAFEGTPEHAAAAFLATLQGLQILARNSGQKELFAATAATCIASFLQ